jgi:biotin carboxyl carrier protein
MAAVLFACGPAFPDASLEPVDDLAAGVPSPSAPATPSRTAATEPVTELVPPDVLAAASPPPAPSPAPSPTASPPPPPPPPSPTASPPPSPEPTGTPGPRQVYAPNWSPFTSVAGIVLLHPSAQVERIGFHQANHRGAQQLEVLDTAVAPFTMESRNRDTGSRSAADVVVDPALEIRAPVTGTVKRAGTYVLYCKYSDDFVVIDPDDRPGWEVKVLHIDGVRVSVGDRVEAGVTVLAPRPTPLPFRSQVDDDTAEPSWPHVHIEVVDPTVPNPPRPGSGC